MPPPHPVPLYSPLCAKGSKRLVAAKSPINPTRRIRDVAPNTLVDQFYCPTVNANLCRFVSPTDVACSPIFVRTTSVGVKRDFDRVFPSKQHGLEGQKATVACFVWLFVAMQSGTSFVVTTKLTDRFKGSRCRSLQQRNFVFCVRAIFVSFQ